MDNMSRLGGEEQSDCPQEGLRRELAHAWGEVLVWGHLSAAS